VAVIDDDGFITITGRISRFSKLAGEMVPHIRVEEAIGLALGLDEDDLKIVVTSVPDAKKGERLVVLYTELVQSPEEICRSLAASGLPPLWVPSPDSFRRVTAIPVLGTGKLDLKRVKDLATAEFVR
jgi:acyl-[acyl-carrier-protein]-phospholipid O-acyltransferase/long-chain-fatty-acid--[acyl-carrier-protein] ligase